MNNIYKLARQKSQRLSRCPICHVISLCLSSNLSKIDILNLNKVIHKPKTLEKNSILYDTGDLFDAIYIANSGVFKSAVINENGEERIMSFHLPGEIMGLDGIHPEIHQTTVTALGLSSYDKVPYTELLTLANSVPQIQENLLKILSREIYSCKKNHIDINSTAKLALFIKNISQRFEVRGFSGIEFSLPISQRDISNHLGMAEETLSRNFKKLQKMGIFKFKKHVLTILDKQMLNKIVDS